MKFLHRFAKFIKNSLYTIKIRGEDRFRGLNRLTNFFTLRHVQFKLFYYLTGSYIAFLSIASFTNLIPSWVAREIEGPIYVQIRDYFKKNPSVSEKLKIIAFDDRTHADLKRGQISTEELSEIISAIKLRKPRVILINRLFKDPPDSDLNDANIQDADVPVISGAYVREKANARNRSEYEDFARGFNRSTIGIQNSQKSSLFGDALSGTIITHHIDYGKLFDGVGYIYIENDGRIKPLVNIEDRFYLKALPLHSAQSVSVDVGNLFVDGQKIYLDNRGRLIPNFISNASQSVENGRSFLDEQSMPLSNIMRSIRKNQTIDWVKEDDVVLITLNYYTGATQFSVSPYSSRYTAIYTFASVINSVLTRSWVKAFEYPFLSMILACIISILLVSAMTGIWFWVAVGCGGFLFASLACWLYAFKNIYISSFIPIFTLITSSFFIFLKKHFESEVERRDVETQIIHGRDIAVLLDTKTPIIGEGIEIDVYRESAKTMTGDWYNVWEREDGSILAVLGDGTGKSVQGSVSAVAGHAQLKCIKDRILELEEDDKILSDEILRRIEELTKSEVEGSAVEISRLRNLLNDKKKDIHRSFRLDSREIVDNLTRNYRDLFKDGTSSTLAVAVIRPDRSLCLSQYRMKWYIHTQNRCRPIKMNRTQNDIEAISIPTNYLSVVFAFTDGYLEGGRAEKKLIRSLDKVSTQSLSFESLKKIVDEAGEESRLFDDKSIMMVKIEPKAEICQMSP